MSEAWEERAAKRIAERGTSDMKQQVPEIVFSMNQDAIVRIIREESRQARKGDVQKAVEAIQKRYDLELKSDRVRFSYEHTAEDLTRIIEESIGPSRPSVGVDERVIVPLPEHRVGTSPLSVVQAANAIWNKCNIALAGISGESAELIGQARSLAEAICRLSESIGERECVWVRKYAQPTMSPFYETECGTGMDPHDFAEPTRMYCSNCGGRIKEETNG